MIDTFHFTFDKLKNQYTKALEYDYRIITCADYSKLKKQQKLQSKVLVNRIDIDYSVKKAERIADLFTDLGIKGTFFVRLHAPEYNPFSFENYRILKKILEQQHELGYHSEVIDQSVIWDEDAETCLLRDIEILNKMFGIKIKGVASHGGMTGLNNLDFWRDKKPSDFELLYEAYDTQPEFDLFRNSFYISDSEWTRWKCYDNGELVEGDTRSFAEHLEDEHPLIYLLIHSDTYFDRHFYE